MKSLKLLVFVLFFASCSTTYQTKYAATKAPWESDIAQLEAIDQANSYPDSSILFIGSSSIRLWETLGTDLAPYPTIRRGYGGASYSDIIHFTERLVYPHKMRALVIFVANDILGSETDKQPSEVLGLFKEVVSIVRKKFPTTPIYSIAVTPTPRRWKVWTETQKANKLIKKYCEASSNLYFIDTERDFLTDSNQPKPELFRDDNLHLNDDGYKLWSKIIKSEIDRTLK